MLKLLLAEDLLDLNLRLATYLTLEESHRAEEIALFSLDKFDSEILLFC